MCKFKASLQGWKCRQRGWLVIGHFLKLFTVPLFVLFCFFLWRCCPTRALTSSFTRFLDHTQRRTIIGRTPLDEWCTRRRDLYLITHNTQQKIIHAPGGIRIHNLNRRAVADLRLRRRGTETGIYSALKCYNYHSEQRHVEMNSGLGKIILSFIVRYLMPSIPLF